MNMILLNRTELPIMPNFFDFHDEPAQVYRILQRLLQYSRASIPAIMGRRSIGAFTLQEELPPEQAVQYRYLLVYPQNPFLGEAEGRRMHVSDVQPGLVNERVQIQDTQGTVVQPDEDGQFLYPEDSPEFDAVNAFYYTTYTLRMFERFAQRSIPWAFPAKRITIDPHVGDQANAFYNEQEGVLGFHTYTPPNGKPRSTAASADIVSHEASHAVLDGLRDLHNESFGLGCRAFHESFADMGAILVAMHDDHLMRRLIDWTQGNLRVSNFVTEMAEHLTAELRGGNNHVLAKSIYLRNAFNKLKALPFDELQYNPPNPEFNLSRQEHNYSRLFTGAFYDMLVGVYELHRVNQSPLIALYRAREAMGRMLVQAIELGPVGELEFADMALAMLVSDTLLYQGRYGGILRAVFAERNILSKAAADEYLANLATLPTIRLPRMMNTSQSAAVFLQTEILPALKINVAGDIVPMNAYRNAARWQYVNYFMPTRVKLEGPQFKEHDGAIIDVFGGITLTFDAADRLRNVTYRPVRVEDIRQVKLIAADMIAYNRLTSRLHPHNTIPQPQPKGLVLQEGDSDSYLVKYPVIYDAVSDQIQGFMDFLDSWEKDKNLPGEE
jgi:hypothetical protein